MVKKSRNGIPVYKLLDTLACQVEEATTVFCGSSELFSLGLLSRNGLAIPRLSILHFLGIHW